LQLFATTIEMQERLQRHTLTLVRECRGQTRLAFAEPQPSLAIHLQMHCKGTHNLWHMQIKPPKSDFFAPYFLPVFCKKFRTPRPHGVRGPSAPFGSPFRSVRMQALLSYSTSARDKKSAKSYKLQSYIVIYQGHHPSHQL